MVSVASSGSGEEPVPKVLKGGFSSFETPQPASADAWQQHKPELRKRLWRLLGDLPPLFTPKPVVHKREDRDGYTREYFTFDNGVGDTVYGYLLIPDGAKGRGPAILYNHYHGGAYTQGKEELFVPAFAPMGNKTLVTGPELVRAGYVVLCIDAYAFGERRFQGPGGNREEGSATEWSLAKTFLWEGRHAVGHDGPRRHSGLELFGQPARGRSRQDRRDGHEHGFHADLVARCLGRSDQSGGQCLLLDPLSRHHSHRLGQRSRHLLFCAGYAA